MDQKIWSPPKGYTVEKLEVLGNEIWISIRPYKRSIATCSGCGLKHQEGYHSSEKVTVRDLPIATKKVYLQVTKRKYRCARDGKIYVEELSWAKKKGDIPINLLKKFIV
jgi:transposase